VIPFPSVNEVGSRYLKISATPVTKLGTRIPIFDELELKVHCNQRPVIAIDKQRHEQLPERKYVYSVVVSVSPGSLEVVLSIVLYDAKATGQPESVRHNIVSWAAVIDEQSKGFDHVIVEPMIAWTVRVRR
jgi:hypothetical protein